MNTKHTLTAIIATALLTLASSSWAETDRGDRIDNRLDQKGERIDNRLDRRGDHINDVLDRRSQRAEDAGNAANDPMQQLAQSDAMQDLVGVLGDLPPRQQQAFMLRIWEGLDVAQTAFAMGCSQGSVKTHLSRATIRLREHLERHR